MANPAHETQNQQTALALHNNGITVIPTKPDTSKSPALAWKHYQNHPNTADEIRAWFNPNHPHNYGLAIVTGKNSGNLEMAEIEGKATHHIPEIAQLAQDTGLGDLWAKINNGWVEQSPTGGIHWIYRVDPTIKLPGNTKLARKHNPNGTPRWEVLTETRSEGGYFIAAPTTGDHHTTGRPWVLLNGGPNQTPTLTAAEREQFHTLLSTIGDEEPEQTPPPTLTPNTTTDWSNGAKPGEDYENQTTWDEILTPHDWTRTHTHGRTSYWIRPGKNPRDGGISATTGRDPERDRLYVFTTSTEFEAETPYTKFGAYALLEHGNDYKAAAKHLAKQGYGTEPAVPTGFANLFQPGTLQERNQWNRSTPTSENLTPTNEHTFNDSKPSTDTPEKSTEPLTTQPEPKQPESYSKTETVSSGSTTPKRTPHTGFTNHDPAEDGEDFKILARSDYGNAARLMYHYGEHIRYNYDRGRWYSWTGTHWEEQPGSGGAVREYAKAIAARLPENSEPDLNWKKKSLSAAGTSNTLTQTETDPRIAVKNQDFDNQPWELNTPGGIVNLRTGELTPSDPKKMHTRITAATPDHNADRTAWEDFLNTTFPEDQEMISYVQRLAGYSMIGQVREHILPFAFGSGGNGKSVFMDTVAGILGDYAAPAPNAFLMASGYQQHSTEIAELSGQRWVNCSEVNERDIFDEAKVKRLTGGDQLKARFMRQDNFKFTPTHHLWLTGNFWPTVESGGDSFWRRLRIIPFVHTVPPEKRIPGLENILTREHAPAILSWLVEGAISYAQDGLQDPARVLAATEEYKESQDTVARFLEDETTLYPGNENYTAEVSKVRQEYETWCRAEGEEPVKGRSFTKQLSHHGILTGRSAPKGPKGTRLYGGIRLNSEQQTLDAANEQRADIFAN